MRSPISGTISRGIWVKALATGLRLDYLEATTVLN